MLKPTQKKMQKMQMKLNRIMMKIVALIAKSKIKWQKMVMEWKRAIIKKRMKELQVNKRMMLKRIGTSMLKLDCKCLHPTCLRIALKMTLTVNKIVQSLLRG